MKNIAVVLAGGSGIRLGNSMPKQFLKVAGKMVIEHTIAAFQNNENIHEVVIVSHPDYIREVEGLLLKNTFTKVKKILAGGKERYHSSLVAIEAYSDCVECNLIFHDSVRPLVNDRIINDCIKALVRYNAVDVATKTTDTIIQVNDDDEIVRIPSRGFLRNGQTPQAFKLSVIRKAYELALKDSDFKTTDDCGVVLKYLPEEPIYVVEGEQFNMKLTYKEDIFILDKLFQLKTLMTESKDLLLDTKEKLKNKVIVVFGGHYGIGADICQIAADCGAHLYSFSRKDGVDISKEDLVCSALKKVYSKENRIDFVVNTAGVLDKQPLVNMTMAEVERSINVNYLGSIIVSRCSYPYLKESRGALLLYTSSSYTRGRSLYSLYSSSKAAIVNFVQAINEEWSDAGVRVNTINPERTKTPMRVKNFGIEPDSTLLKSKDVANVSLNVLCSALQGEVIDVKR